MVQTKFSIGDIIYLLTDPEQKTRMVTGILIRPTGTSYDVSCANGTSWHYDIEMSEEKNQLLTFQS